MAQVSRAFPDDAPVLHGDRAFGVATIDQGGAYDVGCGSQKIQGKAFSGAENAAGRAFGNATVDPPNGTSGGASIDPVNGAFGGLLHKPMRYDIKIKMGLSAGSWSIW